MFQMKVEDVLRIGNNISISGFCENKRNFTNRLVDNLGNEYETYIPLGKDLVIDENNITVCLQGEFDTNMFKGMTLRGIKQ